MKIIANGAALVYKYGENESEISPEFLTPKRSTCWSLYLVDYGDVDKIFVRIFHDVTRDCWHGEAETRMQFTLSKEMDDSSGSRNPEQTTVLQVSKDSDNVFFLMLPADGRGLSRARNVLVRAGYAYYYIKKMVLAEASLTPMQVARLYALSGNYFQPACNVATNKSLVKVYWTMKENIGALDSENSCHALFYYTFASVLAGGKINELPKDLDGLQEMSTQWKKELRRQAVFHKRTKTEAGLIPQERDLNLAHR